MENRALIKKPLLLQAEVENIVYGLENNKLSPKEKIPDVVVCKEGST